ncbi:MAG: outer membrane lipoprotein-sorting protein, partial [Treponema sp.]|nr:outer membrane lipoprotein-sorting protein [Treponema sp.]
MMKRKLFLIALFVMIAGVGFSQTPDATELLRRMERNEIYNTIEYEGEMIIEHGGRRFVKTMKAWARGNTHSY